MRINSLSFFIAAMLSSGAVAVIVFANTPDDASSWMIRLFWVSLFAAVWSWATLIFPMIISSILTCGVFAEVMVWRFGHHDWRLLAGILLVTLLGAIAALRFWRLYGSTRTNQTGGA